jgi:DNA-binding NtrC family response regulator
MNRSVAGISAAAGQMLADYDWPGNVRELQNAIERAVLVCKTPKIEPGDLPLHVNDANTAPVGKSLAEIEQHHIRRTLQETGWNVYRAARLLEIDRVTLYNKIKKYGFKREAELN